MRELIEFVQRCIDNRKCIICDSESERRAIAGNGIDLIPQEILYLKGSPLCGKCFKYGGRDSGKYHSVYDTGKLLTFTEICFEADQVLRARFGFSPKQHICDCGALKANTTHSNWCSTNF